MTNRYIGPIEIKRPDGEYFYTEVCREGDKLITGTFTNNSFLRDQWEVSVEEYYSEQAALEELYAELEEYAQGTLLQ
jgi:hypothetical protein